MSAKAGVGGRSPRLVSKRISESAPEGRGGGTSEASNRRTHLFPESTERDAGSKRGPIIDNPPAPTRAQLKRRAWERAWARGEAPQPRYIYACGARSWSLHLVQKHGAVKTLVPNKNGWPVPHVAWDETCGKGIRIPYRCGNWRCPSCRDFARRRDFVRIEQALQRHPASAVVFMVLTFDPSRFRHVWDAFDAMSPCMRSFAKYLKRNWGLVGYVATVEVHTGRRTPSMKGWPHYNVIAIAPALAAHVLEHAPKDPDKRKRWAPDKLKGAAVRCGWGAHLSAQIPESVGAVMSYCVKVAGDTEQRVETMSTTGEVTKSTQLPLNAPPHFRRLRSSVGFLPPLVHSGEFTGGLKFHALAPEELAAWDRDQAERAAKKKTESGALRAKGKRVAKLLARLAWWQGSQLELFTEGARNDAPEQLDLFTVE